MQYLKELKICIYIYQSLSWEKKNLTMHYWNNYKYIWNECILPLLLKKELYVFINFIYVKIILLQIYDLNILVMSIILMNIITDHQK